MRRFAIFAAVLAGTAAAALDPASSQVVQYQYTPPPPIMPLHSYSGLTSPEIAPAVPGAGYAYARSHRTNPWHRQRSVLTRRGRLVTVPPGRPGYHTFGDRLSRCMQAGSQAGLNASQLGSFSAQCVN